MKLKHSFLIACLTAAPVWAQQVEEKSEVKKSEQAESSSSGSATASATTSSDGKTRTETRTSESRSGGRHAPQPNLPAAEQKTVAYIGVLTREVPAELRSQFSLPEGFGLMVDEVMPDSPAKAAGLKVHDILVKFEDQQLVNMEQLMSLVRAKKKGDVVRLAVISGGRESEVSVTLGEHLVGGPATRQGGAFLDPRLHHNLPMNDMRGNWQSFQNQSREFNEQMERFQKQMREYQERLQQWSRNGNQGLMPQPPQFNGPAAPAQQQRGNQRNIRSNPAGAGGPQVQVQNFSEVHAASNITRRDDSGEYSIKREDGRTTFTARPNNGKEQSWPVNNDEERKAVPQELREKLRMLDGPTSGIQIQINPGSGGNITPQPGVPADETPSTAKKPTTSA